MLSPAFVPLGIALAICLVCAVAGGTVPHKYFQEWQPATIYNFVQLTLCAVVSATIAATLRSQPAAHRSATVFWSIVCAACAFCAVDELFQFHESSGRFGTLVQFSYFLIAGSIAWLFRRDILMHSASVWLFALAAFFLVGSAFLDFGMIDGHHVWLDPRGVVSDGVFKTVEESLKVAGFAMVLGGLMDKLLAARQVISIERMLSQLNPSSPNRPTSKIESLV